MGDSEGNDDLDGELLVCGEGLDKWRLFNDYINNSNPISSFKRKHPHSLHHNRHIHRIDHYHHKVRPPIS